MNNAEKTDTILSQMEQWSILSNVVNYIQYDRHPKNLYNLNIKAVNMEIYKRKSITVKERQMRVRFLRQTREIIRRILRYI